MIRPVVCGIALALLLAGIPCSALAADATAAVVVADDGGLDAPAVRAIRSVTAAELRKHGVAVSDGALAEPVQSVDAHLAAALQQIGVSRVFVLRIGGQLGRKVPLSLEEVSPQKLTPIAAASLTAATPAATNQIRSAYPMFHLQLGL